MHRFKSGRRLQESDLRSRFPTMRLSPAIRIALFAAALATMVSGYLWGDPLVIWQKAAMICLECIGVG
jgi:hypothetical protein